MPELLVGCFSHTDVNYLSPWAFFVLFFISVNSLIQDGSINKGAIVSSKWYYLAKCHKTGTHTLTSHV